MKKLYVFESKDCELISYHVFSIEEKEKAFSFFMELVKNDQLKNNKETNNLLSYVDNNDSEIDYEYTGYNGYTCSLTENPLFYGNENPENSFIDKTKSFFELDKTLYLIIIFTLLSIFLLYC